MEFNTTLVGVIILLLIFVPVGYLILNTTSENKKAKKTVSQLSKSKGLQVNNLEVIGNCVIAVDEASKKLVYSSKTNPSGDFKIIDMTEVRDCRAKSIKQTDKTLDWVGLELVEKTGRVDIPFYMENDEEGYTKDPFVCLQDAKRWETTLRPLLKAS
ncbi:MAG: hypothetical protein CL530_12765 [Aequorivita sp.]|nr:hypothetical protein [Aequorivita sp.]|tara:strand:+ start:1439 stop:1909 length:471 start_codon:yes stop_codon:yes gene_type:complete